MLTVYHWLTVAATATAVVVCVLLHYEALRFISDWLPTPPHQRRRRVVYLILCLLVVHVVEIWIFGLTYFGLLQIDGFGSLDGIPEVTILECVYYSAVVFSTLGFGDVIPTGAVRFVTGMESIAGLTFITWSASYTYLTMTRTWAEGGRR